MKLDITQGSQGKFIFGDDEFLLNVTSMVYEEAEEGLGFFGWRCPKRMKIVGYVAEEKSYTSDTTAYMPKRILQSGNRVIVFWDDGSKTIVKRSEDTMNDIYSAFTAALAIKVYGSNSKVHRIIDRNHEEVEKVNGKQVVVNNYEKRKAIAKYTRERLKTQIEMEIDENVEVPY